MSARDIAVIVLLVGLAGFAVAYFVVGPGRRRGPKPAGDIPLAVRPYHSDDELESSGLERAMAWGVAMVMFMALFLPVYWLLEPERIEEKQQEYFREDAEAGRLAFAETCASCHGSDASGGFASFPVPDSDRTIQWPAPNLSNIVARYENQDVKPLDIRDFITQTIRRGRPGTPMPAWSAAFGGGMNDQEINRIVDYILSIQNEDLPDEDSFQGASGGEIFDANCARCHGFDAQGRAAPGLHGVFARYGGGESGRIAVRTTIENGRLVPTGANMPAWEGVLSGSAISKVVDYLETLQDEGAGQ